jgi:hypothetical protein
VHPRPLLLGGLLLIAADRAEAAPSLPHGTVVLQGLDKVTARTSIIEAPLDQEIRFGTLGITARACLKTPPTEPPESAAFLEIQVIEPGQPPRGAFTGWMFASSPAVSALEHPVYDVWVIDCGNPLPPRGDQPTTPSP